METIKNAVKSGYFQIINFIQEMHGGVFATIWFALLALTLVCILKFYQSYNGKEKDYVKVSMIVLAVIFFACLVFITYIRK